MSSSTLMQTCLMNYWDNKPYIMREIRAVVSSYCLAVDHQRKVVQRTLGGDVVGGGSQTFTICGDFSVICGLYVVPDTYISLLDEKCNGGGN